MDSGTVLDFWFGQEPKVWFAKDADFDQRLRDRFLATCEQAGRGALDKWLDAPRSSLALILVLDQFPRNIFRGTARAFESDSRARSAARHLIDRGWDRGFTAHERMFVYLPLEHSESLADQERCLALMTEIAVHPETADMPRWARAHLEIVRRFGRFPHRNAALGRESTPEEVDFLRQPGSGF